MWCRFLSVNHIRQTISPGLVIKLFITQITFRVASARIQNILSAPKIPPKQTERLQRRFSRKQS